MRQIDRKHLKLDLRRVGECVNNVGNNASREMTIRITRIVVRSIFLFFYRLVQKISCVMCVYIFMEAGDTVSCVLNIILG